MHYSPLQQALNPHLHGRYVSPLAAALSMRPPGPLIQSGVTPGLLLGVLHEQDQRRNAMMAASMYRYSSLGLAGLDPSAVIDALNRGFDDEDEGSEEKTVVESEAILNPIDLAACREAVKAELADLEKQRKALNGQQAALSRRFAEVEGKFQLLKLMESEAAVSSSMSAERDETEE